MNRRLVLAGLGVVMGTASLDESEAAGRIPGFILDTDIGPDVDDAGAVALLHALADRREVRILAMGCCTSSEGGPLCLSSLNAYYGRPDIPVGTHPGSGFLVESKYNLQVARKYPGPLTRREDVPDVVEVYRRVLAAQPEQSVVLSAIGPLNNISRLLASGPDRHSRHTGRELVRRKVRLLSVMGGRYPSGKEWNFEQDPAAAAAVCAGWPGPIVCSGFEIGSEVKTGARYQSSPTDHPVRFAYELYVGAGKNRESWDQTAVLAGVRGGAGLWTIQGGGTITVDPKTGVSEWRQTPDRGHGYLVPFVPAARAAEVVESLMVTPRRSVAG